MNIMKVQVFISLRKIWKKLQIVVGFIGTIVAIITFPIVLYDKIQDYNNERKEASFTSKIIQIKKGETSSIHDNERLLITVDNILLNADDHMHEINGKLNNGFSTSILSGKTQGESIQFDKYIIQIYKIVSDYAEFRVSLINNQ